jgi:hypothetical protein
MRITVGGRAGGRVVRIRLTGSVPGQDVKIQLPVFADVPSPGSYPIADNAFNTVTFGTVTTTRLRVVLQSGQGSVGIIQWVADSA